MAEYNESQINSNETERIAAEQQRINNEANRQTKETEREAREAIRQSNESTRISEYNTFMAEVRDNEDERIANEEGRVNAEASRVTKFSEMQARFLEVDSDINELQNDVSEIHNDLSEIQNDLSEIHNDVSEIQNEVSEIQNDYLPLSGGELTGGITLPTASISNNTPGLIANMHLNFDPNTQNPRLRVGGSDGNIFEIQGASDTVNLRITQSNALVETRHLHPINNNAFRLGSSDYRWASLYCVNNPNVSSDRCLKENIEYIGKTKSELTYGDMYNFIKDDLGLATYNFIGDDKLRMNFIAQDLLANADGTDNKIGQMIVNPVAVPAEEEIAEGKPYPTLSYDTGMYVSVLAGALKEAINKIEQLEARIQELENK